MGSPTKVGSGVKRTTDADGNELLQPLIEDGEIVRDLSVENAKETLEAERDRVY